MKYPWLQWLSLCLLWLAGCSSLPPDCDPESAINSGLSTAMQGKPKAVKIPEACGEKFGADYRKGYQEGYDRGLARFCNASVMEAQGRARAESGEASDFDSRKYQVCANLTAMEAFYRRGYKDGLRSFCAVEGAEAAGRAYGNVGRPAVFPEERYRVCGNETRPMLRSAYQRGFEAGLAGFCKASDLASQGLHDGTQGAIPQAVESRFGKCQPADRAQAVKLYNEGYNKGLASYCEPSQVDALAREAADNEGSEQFPANLSRCLTQYPDLPARFASAYAVERKKVVQSQCTFDRGRSQGAQDAEASNEQKLGRPGFCDDTTLTTYLAGYREGWKATKDRLCDPKLAYDQGRQDARQGSASSFTLPPQCPGEYQPRLYQSYREGYYSWQGLAQGDAFTYSPALGREACLRAGYGNFSCEGVTSIACIETRHPPNECRINSAFLVAVDACLRRGYSPFQCRDVRDRACIESGRSPFQCESPPR